MGGSYKFMKKLITVFTCFGLGIIVGIFILKIGKGEEDEG